MTAKKLRAYQLRLEGYTYKQIARIIGLSESTLRHNFSPKGLWYNDYQTWSQTELSDIRETVHDAFISRALEAAQHIVYLMKNGKQNIAFRAAQDILDRSGFAKSSNGYNQATNFDPAESVARWFEQNKRDKNEKTKPSKG